MSPFSKTFALLVLSLHVGRAVSDYLVPTYPAPVDLTSNQSSVAASWKNLTSILDGCVQGKDLSASAAALKGVDNITFSAGLFSLHDPGAIKLQYHHTSSEVKTAKYGGTRQVDANSIYRVASISKLVTALTGMIELSEEDWNRPLSEVIPDFVKDRIKGAAASDQTQTVQWDKVTLWSLATQLSGIPTIGIPIGDKYSPGSGKKYGAPEVNVTAFSPCAVRVLNDPTDQYCSASETVATIDNLPPNFVPWSTPVYSDLNFMLLGVAISNITGKSIPEMYRSSVFGPLDMTSSYDVHPTDKTNEARAVIVGVPEMDFAQETGIATPSGGILSTISDLQKLGVGILNNTLLSAEATRKWMKPASHTSSLSYSIGAPWEIHRYSHPDTGRVTDLYTKLGDSGWYGGVVVLIPEYDAGFTLLNAGTDLHRAQKTFVVLDFVTNTLLPALEAQAAAEAKRSFVGTYKSTDPNLNVTLKIAVNATTPISVHSDLVVSEWSYNGTDVLAGPFFGGVQPRLEQSIPNRAPQGSPGEVAFQLSQQAQLPTYTAAMPVFKEPGASVIGPWTGFYMSNGDFIATDALRWGGFPASTLVFNVDAQGNATACTPLADRVALQRV
ncbi:MAG: hypothetical protein M4579_005233 [Chaenotheca gracillima]|nr:MAG: hypothetical protein M4579_005233 [Chaenotheca gracillima]